MKILKHKVPLLLLLLALSLLSNFFIWYWQPPNTMSKVAADQLQTDFISLTQGMIKSFEYKDYVEIMRDKNHLLSLPIEAENSDFLGRQKLFLFKASNSETMIFLDVSTSASEANEEWIHSFNYNPRIFKQYATLNGLQANSAFSNHEFALQSFSKEHFNFVILVSSKQKDDFAATEAVSFANALLKYLNNNLKN